MAYYWFKSIHLVGVVSWFAGLFYVGRLFVNHVEALARPEPARGILHEQLAAMTRRCYLGILTPALVVTVGCAIGMLAVQPALLREGWVHAKLGLVVLLVAYHLWCGRLMRQLAVQRSPYGSQGYRVLNEVPTLFLLVMCVVAVFKRLANPLVVAEALGGLVALIALGMWGYARKRARAAGAVGAGAAAAGVAVGTAPVGTRAAAPAR